MRVEIVNRTRVRLPAAYLASLTRMIARALARRGQPRRGRYTLTLALVSDQESGKLNARFRKQPKPTSILSFDYGSRGELILAPHLIRRAAARAGEPFRMRLAVLIAHGMLHLAGFHHEPSRRRARHFERVEREVLERLKIINE